MVGFYRQEQDEHEFRRPPAKPIEVRKCDKSECLQKGFVEVYVWVDDKTCNRLQFCEIHWLTERKKYEASNWQFGYRYTDKRNLMRK